MSNNFTLLDWRAEGHISCTWNNGTSTKQAIQGEKRKWTGVGCNGAGEANATFSLLEYNFPA